MPPPLSVSTGNLEMTKASIKKKKPQHRTPPQRQKPSTETSPVVEVDDRTDNKFCAQVRAKEVEDIHSFIHAAVRSNGTSWLCVTGPPGTGKTETVTSFLTSIADKSLSVLREVGVDGLPLYNGARACFIQAFSLNLRQSAVLISAEFQMAHSIVSSCIKRPKARSDFLKRLSAQAEQSDTILDCVPLLAQVLPPLFVLGIDEVDRFFSVKLASQNRGRGRSQRRRLSPNI
eukprot:Protomagalhaensia_wolfi_Nauph_80__3284@NODE_3343_length_820_cov_10_485275_g2622_i0_p1_GENE_NODE_3343_length_820_cov_10_485275_g2622_i0NODE_3343_length_820_cov_10_485275_g2622_i0_p1_ORF_typecomplete_len231_score35_16AAA_16/PF13191_6/4_2e08AAA_30/PF13604_6/3_4e06AAA_11/PF13086_6/9_5e06AAA_22/PF13401_6/1_2e05T2SSE/PF00437_20/0_00016Rad17/PF03215_15/0_00022AAA/PF00004_29/0_0014AAA_19/PF13245_6/0_00086ATPase_2/PF01637_18/0_00081TniB/PF05621_11/0_0029TniB/PF05621_11/2_1e03IstB_IS21/PF01695_17/0_0046AA